MARLSRGCLRCKQRRVRCDEDRPSCQRCIKRNEVCEGYPDEASLIFRNETEKVIGHARALQGFSPPSSQASSSSQTYSMLARNRSQSVGEGSSRQQSSVLDRKNGRDPSVFTADEAAIITIGNPHPWLKEPSSLFTMQIQSPPLESQAVERFLEKYVMYPCQQTSSPGFLEHLPCMFHEVNINGRSALRWAVQAAAFADLSQSQKSDVLTRKALQCYGLALSALGVSLAGVGKVPDDYDLMSVVVLDIFETLYSPDVTSKGSHAQGMAQILRLKGSDMLYNSRGWSLFRLAHHRIQKQELSFNMPSLPEVPTFLNLLNDNDPTVRLEKKTNDISETCTRARTLLGLINNKCLPPSTIVDMIQELHSLDQVAVTWRQTPEWSFTNLEISERPDLEPAVRGITNTVQLHPDIWMAYEWNYHRTARLLFLTQLLKCSLAALSTPDLAEAEETALIDTSVNCTATIMWLADQILATVPQIFGDVNYLGQLHDVNAMGGPPRCRAIGGYLLLWPIRTIKGEEFATSAEQKERAWRVFERLREYTGMKATLGDESII